MKKEDILRLSRNEGKDEGVQYVHDQGRLFGVIGMVGIFIILSVYYLYTKQSKNVYPLLSMMFGYLCFESYGIFKAGKNRKNILSLFFAAILCLIFLVMSFK